MNKLGLLIVALSAAAVAGAASTSLEELCKGSSIKLDTIDAIKPIIELAKSYKGKACSEGAILSILELSTFVANKNVCSIWVAKQAGQYYNDFVRKIGEYRRQTPKSIKDFFMATAFTISKLCKESLFYELELETDERISPTDKEVIKTFNEGATRMAESIAGDDLQIESLFMVTDMDRLFGDSKELNTVPKFGHKEIAVDLETKRLYDEVRNKCYNKFKPVYDRFISPLVILSNLGFDYKHGQPMGDKLKDFSQDEFYKDWLMTVYICEITLGQKVTAIPKIENLSGRQIEIYQLSDEELAKLKRKFGVSFDEPAEGRRPAIKFKNDVELTGSTELASDELRGQVKSFALKRKAAKSMRKKQLKRFFHIAKEVIDSKKYHTGLGYDPGQRLHWKKTAMVSLTLTLCAFGLAGVAPAGIVGLVLGMVMLVLAGLTKGEWSNKYHRKPKLLD